MHEAAGIGHQVDDCGLWQGGSQGGRRLADLVGGNLHEIGERIRLGDPGESVRRHQQPAGWVKVDRAVVDLVGPDHREGFGRAVPEGDFHLAACFQIGPFVGIHAIRLAAPRRPADQVIPRVRAPYQHSIHAADWPAAGHAAGP